jgi:hypothetical protein
LRLGRENGAFTNGYDVFSTWVLHESAFFGAIRCTCVVLGENVVFLIFGSRWPRVFFFIFFYFFFIFFAVCAVRRSVMD